MNYKKIDKLLLRLKTAYEQFGVEEVEYKKSKPATKKEVEELEIKLGQKLPTSLKDFFLNFSKELSFDVSLPDDYELPDELDEIFCAYFTVSLDEMLNAEESRKSWIESCFNNMDDEYDRIWHNKLGFMTVGNGDVIAFDLLDNNEDKKVVYLSHDDGEGHGYILGSNFASYLENLILVGGCGNEDWQMIPFCQDETSGIDSLCENAKMYREIIGFETYL